MPMTADGDSADSGAAQPPWMQVPPAGDTHTVGTRPEPGADAAPGGAGVQLKSGLPKEYIVSPKPEAGVEGIRLLNNFPFAGPDVAILRTRRARLSGGVALAAGAGSAGAVLVCMDSGEGDFLARQSELPSSPFWIEENRKLSLQTEVPCHYYSAINLADFSGRDQRLPIELQVLGAGGLPLNNTTIKLTIGRLTYLTATTDANGVASIDVPAGALGLIDMILLEPETMHWPRLIREPLFKPGVKNLLRVYGFTEFDPMFYARGALSWGVQKLLAGGAEGLDGAGCKIGVIDTGCDTSHALLQHVAHGTDLSPDGTDDGWRDDQLGHGTHVCGVLGASGSIGPFAQRGMAPGADIHIYKVFPGNDTFTLGSAIEAAIDDGMDIINMSLSSPPSHDITQKMYSARAAGVACVAAAGNCGSDVLFPASLNTALGISAIGHSDTTPADSLSASTNSKRMSAPDGYFSPSFNCFGNAIDFTSPGVGIVSTYPRQGLRPLDGTSMAAPHVAGLAALYLAHHSALRSQPRSPARLDLLCQLLCQHSFALPFGAERVGYGMPLAPQADRLAALMRQVAPMGGAGGAPWM